MSIRLHTSVDVARHVKKFTLQLAGLFLALILWIAAYTLLLPFSRGLTYGVMQLPTHTEHTASCEIINNLNADELE